MTAWLPALLAGLGAGILSAWGVGGGTLLLLVMTLVLGVEDGAARGINLLFFLPTAGVSLWFHRKNGLLDKSALTAAVPWGLLLAAAGAWLSTAVDVSLLRRPFGVFLLVTAWMTVRKKK